MKCPYCFQDYDPAKRAEIMRLKKIENAKNSARKRRENLAKESKNQ